MRHLKLAAVAAASLCLVPVAAHAVLTVTELQPQTSEGSAGSVNGDWWELTNTGPGAVNLSGHSWGDNQDTFASGETNFFPSVSLAAGASLIVLEENASNEAAFRANWDDLQASINVLAQDEMVDDATPETPPDTFSGLGSSGDGVFFYAPGGALLSSLTYAANVRGVTFEQSADGTSLGLSVAGENGAYVATNGDTGSPGIAVIPEPATLSALAIAGLTLGRRRRA